MHAHTPTHKHTHTHPHTHTNTHTHCALHVACCMLHAASCIRASQDPELGVELYYRDGAECSPNVYRQIRWGPSLPRTPGTPVLLPPRTSYNRKRMRRRWIGLGLAGTSSSVTQTSTKPSASST
jgi:hypothetical protein